MQSEEDRLASFAAIMSGVANEAELTEKSSSTDASPEQLKALLLTQKCVNKKPVIPVTDQISRLIGAVATATIGKMEIGAKVLAFDQIPQGLQAQNQNIFSIHSLCVLELDTYQDLGGGNWQLDFKVLPMEPACLKSVTW